METNDFAYILSNVAALIFSLVAMGWPRAGRMLYSCLFILAGIFNAYVASTHPQAYLSFSELATPFYKSIIDGVFARHILLFVISIACCQLAIGVALFIDGALMKLACVGAIIFLVSIAPLQLGSAFPSTLIMSVGLLMLLVGHSQSVPAMHHGLTHKASKS